MSARGRRAGLPSPLREWPAAAWAGVDGRTPLRALRFVVLDTETTGLDPRADALLSIGAVVVSEGTIRVAESFERMVRPPASAPRGDEAVRVHGILRRRAEAEGVDAGEAALDLMRFVGPGILVAHHVAFDAAVLERILVRRFGVKLPHRRLDTVGLARRVEGAAGAGSGPEDKTRYDLDSVCARFGVRGTDRHTAAGDAFVTAKLLLKLLLRAERRGLTTARALLGGWGWQRPSLWARWFG